MQTETEAERERSKLLSAEGFTFINNLDFIHKERKQSDERRADVLEGQSLNKPGASPDSQDKQSESLKPNLKPNNM